jgi:hypothetical protein
MYRTDVFISKKFQLSLNTNWIGKPRDRSITAKGWGNVELTIDELIDEIGQGYAFGPQYKDGHRRKVNFLGADLLVADIDFGLSIDDALHHPLAQYLTFLYTTSHHSAEAHRFRMVFALPRTIHDVDDYEWAMKGLAARLNGDFRATGAHIGFYGNPACEVIRHSYAIDEGLLAELVREGKTATAKPYSVADGSGFRASVVGTETLKKDEILRTRSGPIPLNLVTHKFEVHCPFHDDEDPSAFTVRSSWEGGVWGLHCSSCGKTWWPEGTDPFAYHFADLDRRVDLGQHKVISTSDRYLKLDRVREGLTLVKAAKGAGKTTALVPILRDRKSVLVIGHRVNLLRHICQRFGIDFYLIPDVVEESKRLGICLDSLGRLAEPRLRVFDTVVIDECEQVLGHFLAKTIQPRHPERLFVIFKTLVARAKTVIAMDADLDWPTLDTLTKMRSLETPITIITNDYREHRVINFYVSDKHLVDDMMESLKDGKRLMVVGNSKARINDLTEAIKDRFPEMKTLTVTAETVNEKEVQEFMLHPAKRATDYQVILSSPSLTCGIDISFEGDAVKIDVVYGFCDRRITSHFEFDQHISRVRTPGATKVWVTPLPDRFDTSPDVIKRDIGPLVDFDEDGNPIYQTGDAFIDMAGLIVSRDRASKNRLKWNFIRHKRQQGWTVNIIERDDAAAERGKITKKVGRRISDEKRADKLMGARWLDEREYRTIYKQIMDRETIPDADRWAYERKWLEMFYRQTITRDLIEVDERGRFRERLETFEIVDRIMQRPDLYPVDALFLDPTTAIAKRFVTPALLEKAVAVAFLLTRTPLIKDGQWQVMATVTKADLKDFTAAVTKHKAVIENTLEIGIREDNETQQLSQVLQRVGMRLELIDRNKARRYRIDKNQLDRLRTFRRLRDIDVDEDPNTAT